MGLGNEQSNTRIPKIQVLAVIFVATVTAILYKTKLAKTPNWR
jgi:hypothetical protein